MQYSEFPVSYSLILCIFYCVFLWAHICMCVEVKENFQELVLSFYNVARRIKFSWSGLLASTWTCWAISPAPTVDFIVTQKFRIVLIPWGIKLANGIRDKLHNNSEQPWDPQPLALWEASSLHLVTSVQGALPTLISCMELLQVLSNTTPVSQKTEFPYPVLVSGGKVTN